MRRLLALFLLSTPLALAQETVTLPGGRGLPPLERQPYVVMNREDVRRTPGFAQTNISASSSGNLSYPTDAITSQPLLFWEEHIDGSWQRTEWPSIDLVKMERMSSRKGLTLMIPQNKKSNPFRVYLYLTSQDGREGNYVLVGEKDAPIDQTPKEPVGTKYFITSGRRAHKSPTPNELRDRPNVIMDTAGSSDPAIYAVTSVTGNRRNHIYSYSSKLKTPTLFWEEYIDDAWRPTDWPTPDLFDRKLLHRAQEMLVPIPKEKTTNPYRVYLYFVEENNPENSSYILIAENPVEEHNKPFR